MCTYLLVRCLLSERYIIVFNHGNYVFSIDLKDAYLHIPVLKNHHHFLHLFDNINLISRGSCHFGWLECLGFHFTYWTYTVLANTWVLMLLFIWMIPVSWLAPNMLTKGLYPFWLSIGLSWIKYWCFSTSGLVLLSTFLSRAMLGTVAMSVSLPSDEPLDILQLDHSLLQMCPISVHQGYVLFGQDQLVISCLWCS